MIKARIRSWSRYGAATTGAKLAKNATAFERLFMRKIKRGSNVNAYYMESW